MSETKFTKGPWLRDTNGGYALGITAASKKLIVNWRGLSRPMSEEGQANSHLIAASPTMYEALTALAGIHIDAEQNTGSGWNYIEAPVRVKDILAARAALSLARGETK